MLKVSDIMRHCRNHFICGYRTGDQQIQDGKIRGMIRFPWSGSPLTAAEAITAFIRQIRTAAIPP